MDRLYLGIIAFPILFSLLAVRVPIGLAMLVVGCSGTIFIAGWLPIMSQVKTSAWHLFSNYSFTVIPLFLLMGNFASKAGMSESLFRFAGACLGHRRGGVAMAAVGACAGLAPYAVHLLLQPLPWVVWLFLSYVEWVILVL